jgi:hypothetical protein
MPPVPEFSRRDFFRLGGVAAGAGLVLGHPALWAQDQKKRQQPAPPATNIDEILKIPRTADSLPGPFPGKVVEVHDAECVTEKTVDADRVREMFYQGLETLTGEDAGKSFRRFFNKDDIIGIKVNPVGAGIISTRLELTDAIVEWLEKNGIPREQMIIWDRFDFMLTDAGYTQARYPGIGIEGLQTMDDAAQAAAMKGEEADNSRWLNKDGHHVSENNFDRDVYYWADVEAPQDLGYLNQHVFNDKYSYFGKLLTKKLTRIINVPAFKNTGNGISMATKNIGYGAVCNTNRLHRPLFFNVCVDVLAFPAIRDKMMLNVTDGIYGQYDGGPGGNAQFRYPFGSLFFATDPFALDRVCHDLMVQKRKAMGVKVNEHPRYTEYLRYAEKLGLGIGHLEKIEHIRV